MARKVAKPRKKATFHTVLEMARQFNRSPQENPPQNFAAHYQAQGYALDDLEEWEWRGIAAEFFGKDDDMSASIWLETLASWVE